MTDGSGGTAIRDTLLVTYDPAGNQPPVLASIGPKTVNVNSNLSFTVSGTDPDTAQSVTVRAKLLPAGATCTTTTGSATGTSTTFSWTPTAGQEGTFPVVFEVFDSAGVALTDSEEVIITVTGSNNPPVLAAVGNKSVPNGGSLTFNLSATDPDGNAVTYQMFNGPPGATLTPSGAFSFSPTAGQNNSTFTGVTLRATDNGVPNLNDDESITITVGAGNNAPVTSATLAYTVTAGQPISFVVSGSDADSAQTLTLSANNGVPSGATFPTVSALASAGVSSTFNWTPTLAQAGIVTVKFLTQDNGTPVLNHEITVTITVNTGPVLEVFAGPRPGSTILVSDGAGSTASETSDHIDSITVTYATPTTLNVSVQWAPTSSGIFTTTSGIHFKVFYYAKASSGPSSPALGLQPPITAPYSVIVTAALPPSSATMTASALRMVLGSSLTPSPPSGCWTTTVSLLLERSRARESLPRMTALRLSSPLTARLPTSPAKHRL